MLTLDKANDSKVLKVCPVNLPGRKMPEKPKASDKLQRQAARRRSGLRSRLAEHREARAVRAHGAGRGQQLTAEGKFDEAYDYLAFLFDSYPELPGWPKRGRPICISPRRARFPASRNTTKPWRCWRSCSAQNPNYRAGENSPTLLQVLGNIADRLIDRYVEQQDYRSARGAPGPAVAAIQGRERAVRQRWRQQLTDLATRRLERSARHTWQPAALSRPTTPACAMQAGLARAARRRRELAAEVARRYPLVIVGVEHPALAFDSLSLHNVAARRAGRLIERLLVELTGPGPEGGRYVSPLARSAAATTAWP